MLKYTYGWFNTLAERFADSECVYFCYRHQRGDVFVGVD